MGEESEAIQVFTPEMIDTMARIWTRSSISLMDVRYKHIHPEQPLQHYRMPSSMLVYAYGGSANIQLNQSVFGMERFGIFHGGKGTTLSILPDDVKLESFMVHYKAETPSFFKKDLQRLLEQVNPFVQLYGFAPSNPVGLVNLFQQMMDSWSRVTAMNQFHAKSLFYQSMHQIYRDLESEGIQFLQPDMVTAAKRYLDEHYTQPISIQAIANMFSISGGQLTRLFKGREGKSLQEYLIQKRLDAACVHLINTDATIREIAAGCGFIDEINLIRMFKKHYRMTPGNYRKINATVMQVHDIDNYSHRLYNEKGLDNLAKSQGDGELTMFGQTRSKQMILAAAMSLLLLLSACGTAPANNTNGAGTQNTPPATTTTQTPAAATKAEAAFPRTYVDATGAEVIIEKKPERLALLHSTVIESFYALGLPPIASASADDAINTSLTLEPLRNTGIIDLGSTMAPNMEALIEAQPDLIVIWPWHEESRTEMEKIAPVVRIDAPTIVDLLREYGKVVGNEEEAEKIIAEREVMLVEARDKLASVDETVVIIWAAGGKLTTLEGTYIQPFYSVEEGLGVKAPEGLPEEYTLNVSLESVAVLNPDHIFIYQVVGTPQEEYDQLMASLGESAVWNAISAVKNDQVYPIHDSLYRGGALGMPLLVDYVSERLLK